MTHQSEGSPRRGNGGATEGQQSGNGGATERQARVKSYPDILRYFNNFTCTLRVRAISKIYRKIARLSGSEQNFEGPFRQLARISTPASQLHPVIFANRGWWAKVGGRGVAE